MKRNIFVTSFKNLKTMFYFFHPFVPLQIFWPNSIPQQGSFPPRPSNRTSNCEKTAKKYNGRLPKKNQIPGVGGDLWIFEVVWRAMNFVLRWWWVLRLRSFAWKWMGNIWNSRQSKMIRFSLHNLSYFVRFLFQQQSSHVTKQYEHFYKWLVYFEGMIAMGLWG